MKKVKLEKYKGKLCNWCRYMKVDLCEKFQEKIELVELRHEGILYPTAIRCQKCLEDG